MSVYDSFMLHELKKAFSRPAPDVLHRCTCPECGRKLINLYPVTGGKWMCRKCGEGKTDER